jgi:Septum formation
MRTGRGWVVVFALVALGVGLTSCSSSTPANDFETGECTNDDLTGSIGEIDTVDCDDQHTAEVIGTYDIDGDDFPGATEITSEAQERCAGSIFEDYVGIPYSESIYLTNQLTPTEDSWDGGDRTVICVVAGTVDGTSLEGSVEGAEV